MTPNRKFCTLEKLLAVRKEAAASGKTVVHCHGCFDIVHPGHIAYLEFARTQGDLLIVSVSADLHVNKGVDRPLIPDELRANSLAALECVDWVYVNTHPTAVELLDALQPDIYVKGREYEANNDPRFLAERDMVIRHGGSVVFSSGEVVYSSSALIRNLNDRDFFNEEKVRRFRRDFDLPGQRLLELVSRFSDMKTVVVGDYILDRYHFCDATGVASESPMMTLRSLREETYDGGAAIVAHHLAALGAQSTLVTSLAEGPAGDVVEQRLAQAGITVQAIRQRRQHVEKSRFIVDQQKMFKVDSGPVAPLDSRDEAELADRILEYATGADCVVLADFGYGLLTGGILDRLLPALRPRVPIITADVSGVQANLLRFKNVDLLCPTEREVRQTLNDFTSGLTAVVYRLMAHTGAMQAMITLGKQGLVIFDDYKPSEKSQPWERRLRTNYLPALANHAIDPMGCGDALLATASLTLAAGGSLQAASYLGSIAAAVEAQTLGNKAVTAEQLLTRISFTHRQVESARRAS